MSCIFIGALIVSQQGPLIFLLMMNSSSKLYYAPKRHSKVLPVIPVGNEGMLLSYLILRNLCSP